VWLILQLEQQHQQLEQRLQLQQEQLQQQKQLLQLELQLVLQQQLEQLELQQLFHHKRTKQEPTEQQQERIISWYFLKLS